MRLNELLEAVQETPPNFKPFSNDIHQIDPQRRISSIVSNAQAMFLNPDTSILDVGTGYGYGAVVLGLMGHRCIGIERNKEKLEEGITYWNKLGLQVSQADSLEEAQTHDGIVMVAGDVKTPEKISPFDVLTAFYISGYMVQDGSFDLLSDYLNKDGRFLISTEGPQIIPRSLRSHSLLPMVHLYKPKGMKFYSIKQPSNEVYDKFLIEFRKK